MSSGKFIGNLGEKVVPSTLSFPHLTCFYFLNWDPFMPPKLGGFLINSSLTELEQEVISRDILRLPSNPNLNMFPLRDRNNVLYRI